MRILSKITAICLLGAAGCICASAQQTRLLSADKNTDYGIAYALPQTALRINVEATLVKSVPGPYRQYASRYLGQTDIISAPSLTAEIDAVEVTTYGVPGGRKYVMQLKPGALTQVCVDADGMLLAINKEAEAPKPEAAPVAVNSREPDMDEYLQYVDADFLSSQSSARRAEMLAQTIMEIRESRLSLSRGTAETMPADGRQLELMLQSLQQQEEAMVRAFTGYTYTSKAAASYSLTPDSISQPSRTVVCRLSPAAGLQDADSYAGEPLYLSIGQPEEPEWPLNVKGEPKELPRDGVMYNMPAPAKVEIIWRGRKLYESELSFGQFGKPFALDPKLFTDKKAPSAATFDPVTGALLEIETIK